MTTRSTLSSHRPLLGRSYSVAAVMAQVRTFHRRGGLTLHYKSRPGHYPLQDLLYDRAYPHVTRSGGPRPHRRLDQQLLDNRCLRRQRG